MRIRKETYYGTFSSTFQEKRKTISIQFAYYERNRRKSIVSELIGKEKHKLFVFLKIANIADEIKKQYLI